MKTPTRVNNVNTVNTVNPVIPSHPDQNRLKPTQPESNRVKPSQTEFCCAHVQQPCRIWDAVERVLTPVIFFQKPVALGDHFAIFPVPHPSLGGDSITRTADN
jgi:hypothetical protein